MREYCKKLILFAVIYYIFSSVSRLAYAVLADIGVSTLPIPLTLCLFEWYCTAPSKMVESCRGIASSSFLGRYRRAKPAHRLGLRMRRRRKKAATTAFSPLERVVSLPLTLTRSESW